MDWTNLVDRIIGILWLGILWQIHRLKSNLHRLHAGHHTIQIAWKYHDDPSDWQHPHGDDIIRVERNSICFSLFTPTGSDITLAV